MQEFMSAIKDHDTNKIIHLLNSKQLLDKQIHQTLTIFKHNYSGNLNRLAFPHSNSCLEGVNRKIKQEQNRVKEKYAIQHLLTSTV